MMRLRTCCFFIPLRIGCFVIGYIHIVYHFIQMILSIIILASGVQLSKLDVDYEEVAKMLIIRASLTLFFLIAFLAFAVLLLIGLFKNRRGYVKAFLIYAFTFLIIYMILFLVSLGYGYIGIWNIILGLLEIIIGAYFLFVVYSQYIAMGNTGINGALYMNNI